MQVVEAIEAQARFDEIIQKVTDGVTFIVTREGKPTARIRRPNAADDTAQDTIAIIEPV